MSYIELQFNISENKDQLSEILIAELGEINFEMFEETATGFNAYILEENYNEQLLNSIYAFSQNRNSISVSTQKIENQNWNKEWETNFQPVVIDNRIFVRAEFHPPNNKYDYELIVQPEMSFGTGHHETTSLVLELMLQHDFKNKTVCDMGCGTGILAVMAEKLGATKIFAIDNDPNCVENSRLNVQRNNSTHIEIILGDANTIHDNYFDIVIANINRNILLADIPSYSKSLNKKGLLFISGFYNDDLSVIESATIQQGFRFKEKLLKNNWCAAVFEKG